MKLFNLDLHVSVIADLKNIFENLGHQVDNWSISGHHHLFSWPHKRDAVVTAANWDSLNQNMCDDFYEKHKNKLKQYDAFIVTHTPSFSLLYERFEKPIIVLSTTRYEAPFFSNMGMLNRLNRYLQNGTKNGNIILLSNNMYDASYLNYFINISVPIIPSLCEYTGYKYSGEKEESLYFSKFKTNLDIPNLIDKDTLGKNYPWSALGKYKSIVHIPYNVSTMSIFEQYTANVPMIFPTKQFLCELRERFYNLGVLSEISWNQIYRLPAYSLLPGKNINCDPNDYMNIVAMKEWIGLADFYDNLNMPHLTYFNSFDSLPFILRNTDFAKVSKEMELFNKSRRAYIYSRWKEVLEKIEKML